MTITHGKPHYCIIPCQDFRPKNWRQEKERVEKLEKVIVEKGLHKKYKTKDEARKALLSNIKNADDYRVQEQTPVYGLL